MGVRGPGPKHSRVLEAPWLVLVVRVVAGDGGHVMAELAKRGDEAEVGALVEQEPHRGGASEATPLGGLGETSSPVTIAFA
jgi:hypothetical protein